MQGQMEVDPSEEPLERYVKCTSELPLQGTVEKGSVSPSFPVGQSCLMLC